MGNSSTALINLTVAISLFVGALTLYAILFIHVGQTVELTNTVRVEQDRNIHTTLVLPEDYRVSGAEILHSIYLISDLGIDIQVDTELFPHNLDIDSTDVSKINVFGFYKPVYERDGKGQLMKVTYIPS
ncbi:hypothetical protein E0485_12310 [Paenibacillus albiflavus]|uniref:Uncharacterized protein n=1 Tax=Paenibacillus albiflavus TaxID=2545760 RepID=A0A4R4EDE8_9BACL|nr:hypothetical protein [Paenibacillus albiflavus]TCZ77233.1 hypothetical protein E0485_12310 [Paenibacillus albiflavus]